MSALLLALGILTVASMGETVKSTSNSNLSSAFMVRLPGCTGTLIAPDWVLTAAHCYSAIQDSASKNEHGDFVVDRDGGEYSQVEKPTASNIAEEDLWTKAVSTSEGEDDGEYWRKVDKIIMHGKFESEALSWKGFDFALLHLQSSNGASSPKGTIAPICLASKGFKDFDPAEMYMSGYGRRFIPHCLTDQRGPATYDVCGRPRACSKEHRTRSCGLSFLYNGTKHDKCIKTETPSAGDPECVALRKAVPELKDSSKIIHVFSSDKYVTTCYPRKPSAKSKGWCTTRPPGVDEDTEPGFTSGWGFCSDDPSQEHCNEVVPEKSNITAVPVSILEEEFCKDKLEANLKVEQPETHRSQYERLTDDAGVVCIGQNHSRHLDKDLFYEKGKSSYSEMEPAKELFALLGQNISRNPIDGGPSCFGDSGGPLFRVVKDDKSGKMVPVLTGVFSFMLWGTCQGEAEPGYYGRVLHALDWLDRYVPSEEVCWYGRHFKPAKM